MAKRDIGYVEQYDSICAGLLNLSTAQQEEPPQSTAGPLGDVDLLCESLTARCALVEDTLDKFLSRPWHAHLTGQSLRRAYHAIRRMRAIDCTTWRDILWYNDSLDRPACLQRLPPCLVEFACDVGWKRVRSSTNPQTDLTEWSRAWDSFYSIYDTVVVADLTPGSKRHLLRRHAHPPPGVNYFYFAWLDRQYDVRMPVLVHLDGTADQSSQSPPSDNIAREGKPSRPKLEKLTGRVDSKVFGSVLVTPASTKVAAARAVRPRLIVSKSSVL